MSASGYMLPPLSVYHADVGEVSTISYFLNVSDSKTPRGTGGFISSANFCEVLRFIVLFSFLPSYWPSDTRMLSLDIDKVRLPKAKLYKILVVVNK